MGFRQILDCLAVDRDEVAGSVVVLPNKCSQYLLRCNIGFDVGDPVTDS